MLPTATMFSQPDWAKVLTGIAAGYGIEVRLESRLVEIEGGARRAVIADARAGTKEEIGYDIMHVTPPQSAPDRVKASPLADPASPFGMYEPTSTPCGPDEPARHEQRHPAQAQADSGALPKGM